MPTPARDLCPGLDSFTMRAAIFAVFCCQTSTTGMFTKVLVFIIHRESLSNWNRSIVGPRFDLVLAVRWEFRRRVSERAAAHWRCEHFQSALTPRFWL